MGCDDHKSLLVGNESLTLQDCIDRLFRSEIVDYFDTIVYFTTVEVLSVGIAHEESLNYRIIMPEYKLRNEYSGRHSLS